MDAMDLAALRLSFELAAVTVIALLLVCTPLAWWLAHSRHPAPLRAVIEATLTLPLALPPSVLGFYLLVLLAPGGFLGGALHRLGLGSPVFSFPGLVIGSMLYSLPFAVLPLRDAFARGNRQLMEVAATLRASPWDRFVHIALPLAVPGFVSAAVLCFAHTLGEFGVVLMIGGNIPGLTRTASTAIYSHVESMEYGSAHSLSLLLVVICLALLSLMYWLNYRRSLRTYP